MAPREPNPVTKNTYSGKLARRMRKLRLAQGLSVKEVAGELGVQTVNVYKWESGENKVDADLYPILAKLYKVSAAEFFPSFR